MTKTIVLVPVYNCGKNLPAFFNSLYNLDPQPSLYVFAENNSTDNTLLQIQQFKLPHKVIRVWFRPDAAMLSQNRYVPIAQIRQLLLTFARNYDPDYALFLDSDVYPQTKELIKNLTHLKKDLVGGAYLRAFPDGVWLASKWKSPIDGQYTLHREIQKTLDEPLMTSAGCMCLSRKIIQDTRVNFYPVKPNASEDFGYCLQASANGYKIFLDGTNKLEHVIPEKIPIKPWSRNVLTQQYEPFFYDAKKDQINPDTCSKKLRIGLLSTRFFGVPPSGYSGLEQVVWDLACGLDSLGHEVTLFAPKGSQPPPHGRLVEIGDAYQTCMVNWLGAELEAYDFLRNDEMNDLDILHGHNWFGIEYLRKARNKELHVAHTHHGLNVSWFNMFKQLFKLNLISISDWTKEVFASQGFNARRCYNGVNVDRYEFQKDKTARLMFLGRISQSKAPHIAIKAARDAGVGLDVVGSTSFIDDPDYVADVKKLCDGKQVRFIGEVGQEEKIEYLKNAKGLLIPSNFGEPFGLISIEAMACGTVPIALNDGALKEIIKDGQTGFICNSVDQMVARIREIELIDSKVCRVWAKEFSREKMAQEYVKLYHDIINGQEW
ncbi:MAG: glycosyltransferase [Candidatus Bathyarchaeota archaeon]|nr:glycosyltransferase [Candidatus Termiticorpusculum sp.]